MSVISQLRSATNADDSAFIVEMARHACVTEDWPLPDADDEEVQGLLPRSGDIAVVAVDAAGIGVGAAWTFHHNPPLLISDCGVALPEIAVAVTPAVRGNGVGSAQHIG